MLYPEASTLERPHQRDQCVNGTRPCPWVGCKFNLYLDVNEASGTIKYVFPDTEPWDIKDSCVLDIADEIGCTLEEVGAIMNLTRERVRQIEEAALVKLHNPGDLRDCWIEELE